MYVVTAKEMKEVDSATSSQLCVSSLLLMEHAAEKIVDAVVNCNPQKVIFVCGNGNNAGDGIAAARLLLQLGINVSVFFQGKNLDEESMLYRQITMYRAYGGKIVNRKSFISYDVCVDCIFGTGLNRAVDTFWADVIKAVNNAKQKGSYIISADLPSGIHSDTGAVMGCAVHANETIAFGYPKRGHLLYPGAKYVGKLSVFDIGISYQYITKLSKPKSFTYLGKEPELLPPRVRDSNKGSNGRVLIIAGSKNMSGACFLSALAAYKSGVGLVDIFTDECNREIIQKQLPEAILHTYDQTSNLEQMLPALFRYAKCVVIGPGLSMSDMAKHMTNLCLKYCKIPMIIDADALNCIASDKNLLYNLYQCEKGKVILTPHPGELSRLTGKSIEELKKDYVLSIQTISKKLGVITVGKGAGTVISDGNLAYINCTGNDGMAVAGSGDVLTGIIAALIAQGKECFDAACVGTYLHGMAGDVAVKQRNRYSLMASNIAEGIERAINELE